MKTVKTVRKTVKTVPPQTPPSRGAQEACAEALLQAKEPALQSLGIDLQPVTLAKARACARLPQQWCEQLERTQGSKRQVLSVKRCTAGSDAAKKLRNGDMLLEVGGQVAYTFRDVEQASFDKPRVELTVIRDEQELKVEIDTLALSSVGTDRIVQWSGMLLQPPHLAVLQLGYVPEGGSGGLTKGSSSNCTKKVQKPISKKTRAPLQQQ